MTILILGAGGFIGSHLVAHLVGRGEHRVIGLDTVDEKLAGVRGRQFTFCRADVRRSGELVEKLIRAADVVVDLVAYANPSIYVIAPLDVFDLNFTQNLQIARLCIRHQKRLIQYSSAEVYGKTASGDLCHEDSTDSTFGPVHKPRWIYATAKLLLERVLHAHGVAGELDCTIVRPFNFLGPRIDYLVEAHAVGGPRVFPHFMSALLTGGPIRLVDGGRVHRTFLHIDDAVTAFQVLLDHPERTRNEIFNVGNPSNNTTIRGLALRMVDLYEELTRLPASSAIVEISGEEFYGKGYEDGDRLPPDISKLQSLGWKPHLDLQTTLRETMAYYLASEERPPVSTVGRTSGLGALQTPA
jgi:UDP-apiose/xylose synthase